MKIEDRPTDMLLRQQAANRAAAKGRDRHGRKLFCHLMPFRPHFVREMLAMRAELRQRESHSTPKEPK